LKLSWLVKPSSSLRAGAFINEKSHLAFSATGMKVVYPMGRPSNGTPVQKCNLFSNGVRLWAMGKNKFGQKG
jgi:hypothetical protein